MDRARLAYIARDTGIQVPEGNGFVIDHRLYPHWNTFALFHLGRPAAEEPKVRENAKIIAQIPFDCIRFLDFEELRELGCK